MKWCNTHEREASECSWRGGILLPCRVVDLTGIAVIEPKIMEPPALRRERRENRLRVRESEWRAEDRRVALGDCVSLSTGVTKRI